MKRSMNLILALLAVIIMTLAGCGGGGGGSSSAGGSGGNGDGGSGNGGGGETVTDRDGDGIPNTGDSFPDDPARFAEYATVLLDRLTGGQFGAAIAINGENQVVGLSGDSDGVIKAVKWTADGIATPLVAVELPSLEPGGYSAAYGINEAGVAVGESENAGNFVPVVWPAEGTVTALSLTGFAPPAVAYSISSSRIVGEATVGDNQLAVLWNDTAAAPVSLGTLGGATSAAYYINDAGMVVGESVDQDGAALGAVWFLDAAGVPSLPVPLAPLADHVASVAFGINRAGEVVGESESASGDVHAVLWVLDGGGLPGLAVDLGIGSGGAINDGSRIAGSHGTPNQATVWDTRNTSLTEALLTGSFSISQAYGMNEANLIVGLAGNQGFVTVPVLQ